MANKAFLYYLSIAIVFFSVVDAVSSDYWISYTSYNEVRQEAGAKFLLKIDALGNVLIPARKVVPENNGYVSPKYGATALFETDRNLIMWIPTEGVKFNRDLFRAEIDKNTLDLVLFERTKIKTANVTSLQVSQKVENNFLAVQQAFDPPLQTTQWYSGVPLGENGRKSGSTIRLFDGGAGCITALTLFCEMGVSADGRLLFFFNQEPSSSGLSEKGFILQRLSKTGRAIGDPVIHAHQKATPLDVSNRIGANRFVLYNNPALFVQALRADTLEKFGDPTRISRFIAIGPQTAALDPKGRFVIYITGGGHPSGDRLLLFQALDGIGRPSGQPKVIADKVQSGLDILQDR